MAVGEEGGGEVRPKTDREILQGLIEFIRADQCSESCRCCGTFLKMANIAAREASLPDGVPCYRCPGTGCRFCKDGRNA